MATSLIDNAVLAVVNHLAANVTATYNGVAESLRVEQGWAENNKDVDLTRPFAVVTHLSEIRHEHYPYLLNCSGPPPYKWHVADLLLTAQLDLFAPYRRTRAEVGELIRQNLHNDMPHRVGLFLNSADYFNSQITVHSERGRDSQMAPQAQVGEWRRTWDLDIACSEIVTTDTPTLASVLLRLRTSDTLPPDEINLP